MTTIEVLGRRAVTLSETAGSQLYRYSNAIDAAGPITPPEAQELIAIDPSLVYTEAPGQRFFSSSDLVTHVEGLLGDLGTRAVAAEMVDLLERDGYAFLQIGQWVLLNVGEAEWLSLLNEATEAVDEAKAQN